MGYNNGQNSGRCPLKQWDQVKFHQKVENWFVHPWKDAEFVVIFTFGLYHIAQIYFRFAQLKVNNKDDIHITLKFNSNLIQLCADRRLGSFSGNNQKYHNILLQLKHINVKLTP